MRHTSSIRRTAVAMAVPAAVAGSIALVLTAPTAASAVERESERVARVPKLGVTGVVVPQRAPSAVTVPATYTVQRGDTVFGIATRYGLRTADVLALNGLNANSRLLPGQKVKLVVYGPRRTT